jgi:hypothetical protein
MLCLDFDCDPRIDSPQEVDVNVGRNKRSAVPAAKPVAKCRNGAALASANLLPAIHFFVQDMANKNRRKRTRGSANATDNPSHDSQKPISILIHLRRACLAATAALLVATILATTDTSPELDTFAVLGMMWPVLLAIWAVVAFSSAGGEIRWSPTDIALAVLLLLIVASGVVAIGAGQGSPRPTINMTWRWIGCGIAYFLIRQLVRTRVQARALVAVMISLAVGLAALGCYQYFVTYPQKENHWEELSEDAKQQEIVNAGITYSKPGTPERKQFEDRWLSDEPLATFSLTNS